LSSLLRLDFYLNHPHLVGVFSFLFHKLSFLANLHGFIMFHMCMG
jgi:hypothetical protein